MDFSSIGRALESLHRRQPPLSSHILSISNELYSYLVVGVATNDDDDVHYCDNHNDDDEQQSTMTMTNTTMKNEEGNSNSSSSSVSKWPIIFNLLQELMGITVTTDTTGTTGTRTGTTNTSSSSQHRWEPLAVGLYVSTELMILFMMQQQQQSQLQQQSQPSSMTTTTTTKSTTTNVHPVYMDGPRVPTTKSHPEPLPTTSSGSTGTSSTTTSNIGTTTVVSPLSSVLFGSTTSTSTSTTSSTATATTTQTTTTTMMIPFVQILHQICMEHLEHVEPRLRTLVAKAVGTYTTQIRFILLVLSTNSSTVSSSNDTNDTTGSTSCTTTSTNSNTHLISLLQEMYDMLIQSIGHHIQVGRNNTSSTDETTTATATTAVATANNTTTTTTTTSATVVDDTTGWRAIETNWLCLASFIHGLSHEYYTLFPIPFELYRHISYSAITHKNRHVRAAAMQTYEQWIHVITASILVNVRNNNDDDGSGNSSNSSTNDADTDSLRLLMSEPSSELRMTLIEIVKTGLADNWSQVRMASSVLCRVWFISLQTLQISIEEPIMIAALLPRMCLNRFYLAQGVKLYSYETWKLIFGSSSSSTTSSSATIVSSTTDADGGSSSSSSMGLRLVVDNINAMIRYYIKMCDADNHAVREAACQAIAELAVKVGTNELYHTVLDENQIQNLIAALLMCFYDESWPVRDEACLACGILCKAFPQACHTEIFHKTLWERFTEQLTDQIWSVRENAAVAIGDVLEAYGDEILPKLQLLIKTLLPSAKEQPSMSANEYKDHVNDLDQHTDNQLYSCGSLAPKLRKGGAGRIGCTNCGIDRPKAPWEATDGCIYMIREYVIRRTTDGTVIPISDEELIPLLTELADVCRVRHFPQSDDVRATLWKCLPIIAAALGKQRFKNRYLDIFMELLFNSLESSSASQLSHHAAGQCAEELASLIGMNMFRARLEDHQRQCFDTIVQERHMMPKGPAGGSDIFSPFGPPGLFVDIVPP